MSWFTEVRKVALLACVTTALTFLWQVWGMIPVLPSMPLSAAAMSIALMVVASVTPVFYFVLYRNEHPLDFPSGLRRLSRIAAVLFGILTAVDLLFFLDSLGGEMDTINLLVRVVGIASSCCYLLLLIAIARAPAAEAAANGRPPGPLEVVSRVAVIAGGLWLIVNVLQTGVTPYMLWTNHQHGPGGQILQMMLTGPLRRLVTAGCIFAAPYIVSTSVQVDPSLLKLT